MRLCSVAEFCTVKREETTVPAENGDAFPSCYGAFVLFGKAHQYPTSHRIYIDYTCTYRLRQADKQTSTPLVTAQWQAQG